MPLLLVLVPLAALALVLLVPFTIVQRYRTGSARRRARGWLAAINAVGFGLSTMFALASAALVSRWLPGALEYALAGTALGCALGLVGLIVTRWEAGPGALHYTPSRVLVLGLTIVVGARLLYGWARMYHAWTMRATEDGWFAEAGAEGAVAAGAMVLAYYFTYWSGVHRRVSAQRGRPAGG